MNNPKMVEESITASRQNEGFRHWLRFSVACLSLKAFLESLNQLVFQATKEDKLALLSGDNIIQIKGGGNNLAARSHHVAYQFSSHAGFIEPREIVLLKYSVQNMHIDSLCRTGATRISMSAELGDSVEAEFWEFDDYLNPYAPLLNVVERLN